MDGSTNYYFNYTHGSTPSPNDPMMGYSQPVPVLTPGIHVPVLIHRKIHINPSVLLSQRHHENYLSPLPLPSHSWSPRIESRSEPRPPVKKHQNKRSRNSRNFRRHKRVTDKRNIDNNGSKISSRELARMILKTRAEEDRAQRNDDDIDELMNRELTNREKFKRTVDARLWLQAKTALDTAKQITEVRDQECKNYKAIRLEIRNKTFVNRGTSPIIFESGVEGESISKFNISNDKTEVELLKSDDDDDDDCQVIEIDSKTEAELLRDDDDDEDKCVINSQPVD